MVTSGAGLQFLGWQPREFSGCNLALAPYMKARVILRKEANYSRLIGDRFNKQENVIYLRLGLGSHKTEFLHQNLKSLWRGLIF